VRRSGNRYFLMRHGEAEFNVRGIVNSDAQVQNPLTAVGKSQVRETAKKLKKEGIDLIITSPMQRTQETARMILAELGLPPSACMIDERLAEIGFGTQEGLPMVDIDRLYSKGGNLFSRHTSDGETLGDLRKRAGDILFDIERRYVGKTFCWLHTMETHGYLLPLHSEKARRN